jgi:hypothetical protein
MKNPCSLVYDQTDLAVTTRQEQVMQKRTLLKYMIGGLVTAAVIIFTSYEILGDRDHGFTTRREHITG